MTKNYIVNKKEEGQLTISPPFFFYFLYKTIILDFNSKNLNDIVKLKQLKLFNYIKDL
jgi:hypothetical protein